MRRYKGAILQKVRQFKVPKQKGHNMKKITIMVDKEIIHQQEMPTFGEMILKISNDTITRILSEESVKPNKGRSVL